MAAQHPQTGTNARDQPLKDRRWVTAGRWEVAVIVLAEYVRFNEAILDLQFQVQIFSSLAVAHCPLDAVGSVGVGCRFCRCWVKVSMSATSGSMAMPLSRNLLQSNVERL